MSEHAGQRPRDPLRLEGLDEQRRIAEVAAAVLQPAAQLRLDRSATPRGLVLEVAERRELSLRGDDLLYAGRTERANQLVLEVRGADVRRSAEHAPEPAFLACVAQADDAFTLVLRRGTTDRLRAADRHDLDALQCKVEAELRRNRLERDPVGDPFDEDDRHVGKLA